MVLYFRIKWLCLLVPNTLYLIKKTVDDEW